MAQAQQKTIGHASASAEFREIDLKLLEIMRRLDAKTDWMNLITCTQRAGLTLREIAELVPCSVSTVSRWQSGKALPAVFLREPLKDMLLNLVESKLAVSAVAYA
jgi:DNA-directed RNA polymerase specialized sigma subunit